jgi:hypothetical protein
MHRSETRELKICADCGAETYPGRERAYAFGAAVLCWACALRRGGTYDEVHDRWVEAPATGDLPRDEP